jgi:hypothetical protein
MSLNGCSCGSTDFIIISEKIYEEEMENGIPKCVPDNEMIIEVECKQCQKEYDVGSFREISY